MKSFLSKIIKFTFLVFIILCLGILFIPDKSVQSSILGAYPTKHELLKQTTRKKIILLGGSNLSFGIDSKQIETALKKPVINMGIHAGVGLEFMINDIKPYISAGDTVIVVPEYEHFYTDNFYGEMELISVLFDIEPQSKKTINKEQWIPLLKYLPTYSAKKIKNFLPSVLKNKEEPVSIYHKNSFNENGDAYLHWSLPNQTYLPAVKNKGNETVNKEVITQLLDLKKYIRSKQATLLIFPPVIDETSYNNQEYIINKINTELADNQLIFVSNPINYKYKNQLFFNSYYHLNKTGVDKRTQQLINDLLNLKVE
jgi:hypothetical protein